VTEPPAPGALRAHLDDALGDLYVIEHELGGAGMSRVFVARELALGRQVVLKVLPPDLAAGLNVERFRREIQLAAGLQHPHVVPVLSAGSAGGVPYYAMPLVEGESLRARLARDGALPPADAVRVLHDVADALAYAHARGIVHRDVKPDNVLLTGLHALVTDFGVAKALRTAFATPASGEPDATGAGLAIGTPAYMAPEQAAADPSVDHRADLYAFGVLAYEALAGVPPFQRRTPAEVLTAHLAESPEPLDERVPGVPPALAALVMACLAKRPEDRPAGAAAVRDALSAAGTVATPGGVTPAGTPAAPARPPRARRRRALAALGVALVATVGAALGLYRTRERPLDAQVVAVAPFRVAGTDPSLRYLREGMLDLLAATLTGEGGPRSADPRAVLSAWRRAAGGDDADLPRDRALDVAEGLGAGRLLTGEIAATAGGRVALTASLLAVRDGRGGAPVRVEGSPDSLPQLVERLAVALLSLDAPGGDRGAVARPLTTSLPALRAYLGGTALYRRSRYRESAREFERALSLDTTFAQAGLGLAVAAGWFGEADQQYRGLQAAWRERERLSPVERASLEAAGGPAFPRAPTMRELYAAKQRYARVAPDRPDALFQAADAMFHFGAVVGEPDAEARAAAQFRRVLALDSTYLPALEHLVLLAARSGDTATAREAGALFLRGDSTAEGADGVRWRVAVALDDTAALDALERRAGSLHPLSVHLIEEISLLDGVDLERAARIAAANAQAMGAERSASDRVAFSLIAHDVALARGQPGRAAALLEATREAGHPAHLVDVAYVLDALFGEGDTAAAAAALRALEPIAYGPAPAALPQRYRQESALCAAEMWRVARGDVRTAAQSVARLRTPYRGVGLPPRAETPTRSARACAVLLEATVALEDAQGAGASAAAGALAAAERLDSLLRGGEYGLAQTAGPLVLARLRETLGDERGALAALRRRPYFYSRQPYLASMLREEARLAARLGDGPGAARAARHYAALRAGTEKGVRDDARRTPLERSAG
jgi:serine/threonine-protein kinase